MTDYDDRPELAPSERLPPELEAELAEALRAAFRPEPLAPERHAELLALALEDPFAPASAEEVRESERLRQALEDGDESHPDALLARALRAAVEPDAVREPVENRARTLAVPATRRGGGRGSVVYVSFGVLSLAAAAAFAVLFTRPLPKDHAAAATATARPALAQSRTTGALFHEPFERGETTARIDRITLSRERELRENRYALWGVR